VIPIIVEPPPLSTEAYIESARRSIVGGPSLLDSLKSQHAQEIAAMKTYHLQKEAKIQEDHATMISQYEKRIADQETQLRESSKTQSSAKVSLLSSSFFFFFFSFPSSLVTLSSFFFS
jgi:Skp family chaperone for outer membrane proteins